MRRFFSFVAFLGIAWLPAMAAAQEEQPPPVGVDVDVEPTPPPPAPPPPAVVLEPEVEAPPPAPPDYEFEPRGDEVHGFLVEIQPYGWLPLRMSGDTVFGGQRTPLNVRLKDLYENDQINVGGGLRVEAWAMRLGLIADGAFLQLERNTDAGGEFRSRQFIGDFLGGLRVIQTGPLAGGPSFGFAVTGGLRLIYDRERIAQPGVIGGNVVERDDWIAKGSVGGEIPIRFGESFGLRARGQVRYPDFDWTVVGLAEFDALPVGVDVGYRYENLDYEEGGIDTDVDLHTVYLGLGFQAGGRRDYGD